MLHREKLRFNSVGAFFFIAIAVFVVSLPSSGEECVEDKDWLKQHPQPAFFEGTGCHNIGERTIRFKTIAFSPAKVRLGLTGSSNSNEVPTRSDVVRVERGESNIEDFFLSNAHARQKGYFALAPIGYPAWSPTIGPSRMTDDKLKNRINHEWLRLNGFLRVNGETYSNFDAQNDFKSAFLCLSMRKKEPASGGSVPFVFNAFEDGIPRQMSGGLRDAENCPDVVQVGPRIVEYRAEEGVAYSKHRQRWLIFSIGNGRRDYRGTEEFFAYVIFFHEKATLKEIQEILLESDAFSKFDDKMRTAVALTSNNFSNVSVTANETTMPQQKLWYAVDRPHPVYLTLKMIEQK